MILLKILYITKGKLITVLLSRAKGVLTFKMYSDS